MPEKTDEELIHLAEDTLREIEEIAGQIGHPKLTTKVERLHRRLNRCLNRYNRDYAGDNQVSLRSGGAKPDDTPAEPTG